MSIHITTSAAKKVCELASRQENKDTGTFLRISVSGGGCSGFQYDLSLEQDKAEEDQSFSCEGAVIIVDEMSLSFLKGSTLDFVEDLTASQFVIKNPNAAASCGCGNSFAL